MSRVASFPSEAVQIAARKRLSATIRLALVAAYDGKCGACGKPLPYDWQLDHRLALALGGRDEPSNWTPLCARPCHLIKTAADVKAIAKAKRIERQADPATRKRGKPIPSRPFSKTLKRSMSGAVVER